MGKPISVDATARRRGRGKGTIANQHDQPALLSPWGELRRVYPESGARTTAALTLRLLGTTDPLKRRWLTNRGETHPAVGPHFLPPRIQGDLSAKGVWGKGM